MTHKMSFLSFGVSAVFRASLKSLKASRYFPRRCLDGGTTPHIYRVLEPSMGLGDEATRSTQEATDCRVPP